jgi:ubiquinone/menaquinone biosynthesis C-methylase UbiE
MRPQNTVKTICQLLKIEPILPCHHGLMFTMEFTTALHLIEKGIDLKSHSQYWADLGAGTGLFTKALASLLPAGSTLLAIDRDASALNRIDGIPKEVQLIKKQDDFTQTDFGSQLFDGLLMANSFHFVADHKEFLHRMKRSLKPDARIIFVEYDMDSPNTWVPYPISFASLRKRSTAFGFSSVVKLEEVPSIYHRASIYSAIASS